MCRHLAWASLCAVICGSSFSACQRRGATDTSNDPVRTQSSSIDRKNDSLDRGPTSDAALSPISRGERIWQAKIQVWNDLTDAIERDSPQDTFNRLVQRLLDLATDEKKLNLPAQEQIELEAKYMPILREANRRQIEAEVKHPTDKLTKALSARPKTGPKN